MAVCCTCSLFGCFLQVGSFSSHQMCVRVFMLAWKLNWLAAFFVLLMSDEGDAKISPWTYMGQEGWRVSRRTCEWMQPDKFWLLDLTWGLNLWPYFERGSAVEMLKCVKYVCVCVIKRCGGLQPTPVCTEIWDDDTSTVPNWTVCSVFHKLHPKTTKKVWLCSKHKTQPVSRVTRNGSNSRLN